MARTTKSGKHSVVAEQSVVASSLVMNVLTLSFFTPLADRIAFKISYANLGIGFIFLVTLGGCGAQPAIAFQPSVNFLCWLQWFF